MRVSKSDVGTNCQIVTVGDMQDFQTQISKLGRELEVERKRTEALTFKILARDEEIKKIRVVNDEGLSN
jgi:hypothetical protein